MSSSKIFSPGTMAGLQLRNRIVKTATYEGMYHEGFPTRTLQNHHVEVGKGGVGMTTVAYCSASPNGRTFANQMYMREEIVPHLAAITGAVHEAGAAAALQIGHCGFFSKNKEMSIRRPRGPSGGLNPYGLAAGYPFAEAMKAEHIDEAVEEFGHAAALAARAGFDAVEIHLGHGYLLSQFISPKLNRRRDEFGGSLENRLRFPRRVLERVQEEVGADFPVIAKTNLSDGVRGGLEIEEAVAIAEALSGCVDAFELSGGLVSESALYLLRGERPLDEMIEVDGSLLQRVFLRLFGKAYVKKYAFEEMFFLDAARRVRDAVETPLILLGGVTDRDHLDVAMEAGFDFVAMGRALIHDPELINKYQAGEATASGCTPCNKCISEMDRPGGVRCAEQPHQLRSRDREVEEGWHTSLPS